MKNYRVAIVGLGRMASTIDDEVLDYPPITLPYSVAAACQKVPQLTLIAGADIQEEKCKAFRERWATDAEIARDDARDIVRILTNPDEREAEIAKLVLLLVGEEPDFDAWMESFAVGSYELRENVRYANRGQRGMQPARFFQDQQRRIDRIVNENLSPAEAAEWRNAYEDAMRLIIASLVLKEMRVGVAAKAALWIA